MFTYEEAASRNRLAYDAAVERRADVPLDGWKLDEDAAFMERLRGEGVSTLLEIGAGTGVHGSYFSSQGLKVLCTEPSSAMVDHCRSVGLDAVVGDVLHLPDDRSFDAAFAMNCLLHVPRSDLPEALHAVHAALVPGGLFYWGQYGGNGTEGEWADDDYEPKRFFCSLSDAEVQALASATFKVLDFHTIDLGYVDGHFQSLTLRRA